MVIKNVEKPYGTPVAALFPAAVAEVHQYDTSLTVDSPPWDCKAIYAVIDGRVVGFLCWKVTEWLQEAHIALGYVVPEYRRRGIYSAMCAELEKQAVNMKLRAIVGYTQASNEPLRRFAEKDGREVVSIGYRKSLQTSEGRSNL